MQMIQKKKQKKNKKNKKKKQKKNSVVGIYLMSYGLKDCVKLTKFLTTGPWLLFIITVSSLPLPC